MSWGIAGLICRMSWGLCSVLSRAPVTSMPQLSQKCPNPVSGRAGPVHPKAPSQGEFPFTASAGAAGATSATVTGAGVGPGSAVFPRTGHAFQPPIPCPCSRPELPATAEHLHLHPQRPGQGPRAGGAGSGGAGTARRLLLLLLLLTALGPPGCPTGTGVRSRDCTRSVPPRSPAIKDLLHYGSRAVLQPRGRFGHGREGWRRTRT